MYLGDLIQWIKEDEQGETVQAFADGETPSDASVYSRLPSLFGGGVRTGRLLRAGKI